MIFPCLFVKVVQHKDSSKTFFLIYKSVFVDYGIDINKKSLLGNVECIWSVHMKMQRRVVVVEKQLRVVGILLDEAIK